MTRYYCTYFDRNYLSRAVALIESLNRHETERFCLFAVCLDELSRLLLDQLQLPNVVTVALHEIERGNAALLAAKQNRSTVEYYWTLTPVIINWILKEHPQIEVLTYLDSDLFFFASPDAIFAELADDSVLIHEHRFSPSLRHLEPTSGTYNVGLLCFRNDRYGRAVLQWWQDRCIAWCYNRYEEGKFGDQLYLNGWPERFEGVTVLQNTGAGVAPWNHAQYRFETDSTGNILVDGTPLIFYHFHALAMLGPEALIPAKHGHYPLTLDLLRCFTRYGDALNRALGLLRGVLADFSFGLAASEPDVHRLTVMVRADSPGGEMHESHPAKRLDDHWICYFSAQVQDYGASLNQLEALRETERHAETLMAVEAAVATWGETPDLLNLKAELHFQQGNPGSAEEILTALTRRFSRHGRAFNNLAVLRWEDNRREEALGLIRRAAELQPFDHDTMVNLGAMLLAAGEYEEARHRCLAYLQRTPQDDDVYALLLDLEAVT